MKSIEFDGVPEIRFHRSALLVSIVDGDTLDVEIDLGWSTRLKERLRLEHVDTPEINRKFEKQAGKWVAEQVSELFPPGTSLIITSKAYDRTGRVRGKYGRTLAVVYRAEDGLCLNEYLLENQLAWPTDERGVLLEERELGSLVGIPEAERKVGS